MNDSERPLTIRSARDGDRSMVLALVPLLAIKGTPALRDRVQVETADLASIDAAMRDHSGNSALFVAELDGAIVGFLHLRRVRDYYTQSEITHLSDLVVAPGNQRSGVGRMLMAHAEQWARAHGHSLIQLYVLPENAAARGLYDALGFKAEWLKYVKPLDPS